MPYTGPTTVIVSHKRNVTLLPILTDIDSPPHQSERLVGMNPNDALREIGVRPGEFPNC